MQRKGGYIAWLIIIAAIAALFLAWQYVGFRLSIRTLPAGTRMAGLNVEGMSREQALNTLEMGLATPIEITYRDQRLSLPPDTVELRYDAEETAANLDRGLSAHRGLEGFLAYVLRRPIEPIDVPVAVRYSQERMDGFLTRLAMQYDQPPQEIVPLPDTLTFRPSQPGYILDIASSRPRLSAALTSATDRHASLIVQVEEAPPYDLTVLGELWQSILSPHPNIIPGIFVKSMQSGDEWGINADVAYSGLNLLQIAVMEETYRALDPPLAPEVTNWLSDTMGVTSSRAAANSLLGNVIGNGDPYQGVENLTTSMHYLGLINTFMATPYDEVNNPPTIVTLANSRTDVNTQPTPAMQTTPLDMGLLLEMIYQCSQGGGALLAAYPEQFTASECGRMIEWMQTNQTDSLIEAGVPVETPVAHKHGFTSDAHADAALVFSPGGEFVLIIFLHQPEWLAWENSAPLIADIATATYNYFNLTP